MAELNLPEILIISPLSWWIFEVYELLGFEVSSIYFVALIKS
jgi:hypothetical protein